MSRWLIACIFCISTTGAAFAQTGNAVHSGLGSNDSVMSGPNINVVNGVNANGTPKQQSPGSSMTVGAGNSTTTPGVTGDSGTGEVLELPKLTPGTTTKGTIETAPPAPPSN